MKALKAAAAGLGVASSMALLTNFMGFGRTTLLVMLYMYVVLAVALSADFSAPGILSRIVLVTEDEAVKMRKLFSGEKYKIKGEVEKLQ